MDVLIFTNNLRVRETILVHDEAVRRGMKVEVKRTGDISIPEALRTEVGLGYVPSNIFNRSSIYELVNRFLILEELGREAVIINPLMSLLRYSKEYLTLEMERGGFPHPKTLVTENIERAYEFASCILDQGKDVILKPIGRAQGVGVVRLSASNRIDDLMQFLYRYSHRHGGRVFYLQEFVENLGYDIRVFIINGEVVGRMRRSNPRDWRYNASRGGVAEPFGDPIYDELAIKVAEAVDLKITGVDVMPSKEGPPYILEANCYPGYTHLMKATGIQVHERIVDFFQRVLTK